MRAAIFDAPGQPLRVDDIPDPAPLDTEVIIRVRSCGICGSDLHMTQGHGVSFPNGTVLGHEFAGEVVALGRAAGAVRIGDRVAVLPVQSCGECAACRAGRPVRCSHNSIVGCGEIPGGYAEYARAPAAGCLQLPDAMSFDDGAMLEPLSVALRGVRMARISTGDRVLVAGVGPIGLGAIFWAKHLGADRVAAMATSRRRAAMAARMGADAFLLLDDGAGAVKDALGGAPTIVIEASGQPGMIARAIDDVAAGGTVIVLGTCAVPDSFLPVAALAKEIEVRFSFMYDRDDYRMALEHVAADTRAARAMVTGHVGFAQLPALFEQLRGRTDHCKVMIDPTGGHG